MNGPLAPADEGLSYVLPARSASTRGVGYAAAFRPNERRRVICQRPGRAPAAVRYAWSMNPAGANLYNAEGLPASPFRTDGW